jgi:predicted TIM-barrel fold metal-dependent hydrolase
MDRYGIKLRVPSFCAPGLQAEPDPAATPPSDGVLFAVDYPFETVSNTVDWFATAPIAPKDKQKVSYSAAQRRWAS